MRILVNTLPLLTPKTGVGQYTYQIAKHLIAQAPLIDCTFNHGFQSKQLPMEQAHDAASAKGTKAALIDFVRSVPTLRKTAKFSLNLVARLSGLLGECYDLYFEPNFIPRLYGKRKKCIATVHDFSCFIHPEWHPVERVIAFEKYFWRGISKCDAIITVSDYIRQQAIQAFNIPATKVYAIANGVDHSRFAPLPAASLALFRNAQKLPERFALFVGSIEPRKNITTLLQAYSTLPKATQIRCPLILAGGKGWLNDSIHQQILSLGENVRLLGYVTDDELALLYNLASVFVYPSWYEGFGLPPLEAMACGCPVITTAASAMTEVCRDAAQYVDPADSAAIAASIERVLCDEALRSQMICRGLQYAKTFSWNRSAAEHISLFTKICASA